jgi:hypothetical protein
VAELEMGIRLIGKSNRSSIGSFRAGELPGILEHISQLHPNIRPLRIYLNRSSIEFCSARPLSAIALAISLANKIVEIGWQLCSLPQNAFNAVARV